MASGHVNRTLRPNTWLHRPAERREESPCQLGAVHTWHLSTFAVQRSYVRSWGMNGPIDDTAEPTLMTRTRHWPSCFAVLHNTVLSRRYARMRSSAGGQTP
jgi:hypothetical protein